MLFKVSIKNNLTQKDWDNYEKLWKQAKTANPFTASKILQQHKGNKLQIAFIYDGEKIIGAIPFHFNGTTLSLAGEEKSDAINLLFLDNTPLYVKHKALVETFKAVNFVEFYTGKLIDSELDYILVISALKQLGYKYVKLDSIKNPLVKFNKAEYSEEVFLKVFSKRNTRNYCNKLRKNFGYEITAIENFDEEKVKKWLDKFFEFHTLRWNATNTPSIYSDEKERETLYKRVEAWLKEDAGLLFSIDVKEVPFAMAICLKKGDNIIYHQISSTGEEEFSKYPKQKILILELAKWMIENSYKVLDFGVGVEPYKYEYANKDPYIVRIYGSKTPFSKNYIKGCMDYYYRNNPKLQTFVNTKVRPLLSKISK